MQKAGCRVGGGFTGSRRLLGGLVKPFQQHGSRRLLFCAFACHFSFGGLVVRGGLGLRVPHESGAVERTAGARNAAASARPLDPSSRSAAGDLGA